MVVNALKKVDISKIVKTSFDFTIEEVIAPIEEDSNDKIKGSTMSYYNELEKLDQELSNSYFMGRNFEVLTKKEIINIIDKVLTKTPDLYYDTHKLITVIEDDYCIGVYETNAELREYLDIINARDLELMEG